MQNFTKFKSCLFGFVFLLAALTSYGQSVTISGNITDIESGVALPGTTILEKVTANETVSDMDVINSIGLTLKDNYLYLSYKKNEFFKN